MLRATRACCYFDLKAYANSGYKLIWYILFPVDNIISFTMLPTSFFPSFSELFSKRIFRNLPIILIFLFDSGLPVNFKNSHNYFGKKYEWTSPLHQFEWSNVPQPVYENSLKFHFALVFIRGWNRGRNVYYSRKGEFPPSSIM